MGKSKIERILDGLKAEDGSFVSEKNSRSWKRWGARRHLFRELTSEDSTHFKEVLFLLKTFAQKDADGYERLMRKTLRSKWRANPIVRVLLNAEDNEALLTDAVKYHAMYFSKEFGLENDTQKTFLKEDNIVKKIDSQVKSMLTAMKRSLLKFEFFKDLFRFFHINLPVEFTKEEFDVICPKKTDEESHESDHVEEPEFELRDDNLRTSGSKPASDREESAASEHESDLQDPESSESDHPRAAEIPYSTATVKTSVTEPEKPLEVFEEVVSRTSASSEKSVNPFWSTPSTDGRKYSLTRFYSEEKASQPVTPIDSVASQVTLGNKPDTHIDIAKRLGPVFAKLQQETAAIEKSEPTTPAKLPRPVLLPEPATPTTPKTPSGVMTIDDEGRLEGRVATNRKELKAVTLLFGGEQELISSPGMFNVVRDTQENDPFRIKQKSPPIVEVPDAVVVDDYDGVDFYMKQLEQNGSFVETDFPQDGADDDDGFEFGEYVDIAEYTTPIKVKQESGIPEEDERDDATSSEGSPVILDEVPVVSTPPLNLPTDESEIDARELPPRKPPSAAGSKPKTSVAETPVTEMVSDSEGEEVPPLLRTPPSAAGSKPKTPVAETPVTEMVSESEEKAPADDDFSDVSINRAQKSTAAFFAGRGSLNARSDDSSSELDDHTEEFVGLGDDGEESEGAPAKDTPTRLYGDDESSSSLDSDTAEFRF